VLPRLRIAVGTAVAFVAIAACGVAFALSDADILGNWCGSESNYSFTRKVMTVTRVADSARLEFDVVALEPKDESVFVSWRRADAKVVRTEFAEFSADRKKMVQRSNSGGPRREFKRC
jgi:hypothetical protein